MCTVTYLPFNKNNFILTSNRDENPKRKTIPPKIYIENGVQIQYPKDEVAGGTWIGLSEKNRLICLLNGGFKKHQRKLPYKMSRGVIVKLLLTVNDVISEINNFNFEGIEPFTIILVDWNSDVKTYELVWTGIKKYFKELAQEPHIWSSATLYTDEMKSLRKQWFLEWISSQNKFTPKEIIKFHQDKTRGTIETALKMKRNNVETISTTCVQKSSENIEIIYCDYVNDEIINTNSTM